MITKADDTSDKAGIASAVLCTVHCLVVPVLFLLKFSWAEGRAVLELPSWWHLIDYFFLLVSFAAVYHSAGHTGSRGIRISLWSFWVMLAVAILFEEQLHWLAYIASAGLVTTHFLNIRRMRMAVKVQGPQ